MPDRTQAFSKIAEELIGDFRHVPNEEPRKQVKRPTRPLGELVEELMVKHHVGRPSADQTVRDHWVEIVGAANAAHSHVARIDGKILVVLSGHAVVRNELTFHRTEILKRVNLLPGCAAIRTLNIRAG